MKTVRCPDCGAPIALRFPMHNCKPKFSEGDNIYARYYGETTPGVVLAVSPSRVFVQLNSVYGDRKTWLKKTSVTKQ